nr:alpha-2,3-sialyltransferase [Campylobacter coli]EAJ2902984.1 alpha-2,3-sialyltransferase [Campylobacter coli]EAJ3341401.1 alpha-2,3-sialyltransferase [Campylobacter coli]EAJ5298478.1 alpha-2,3-sialyltransferase [Campylobacter coli]EAJ5986966.1 alpha-2,3-sialyltransferase [Campylobacter coli]
AEVLEELSAAGKLKVKNLKMHRLDVPPVELIAKQYELEQKLNIKFSIENVALFSELEKKIDTLALNNTAIINNANNTTLLIQNKDQYIHNLEQNIQNLNHQILFKTAKARIQNHL